MAGLLHPPGAALGRWRRVGQEEGGSRGGDDSSKTEHSQSTREKAWPCFSPSL